MALNILLGSFSVLFLGHAAGEFFFTDELFKNYGFPTACAAAYNTMEGLVVTNLFCGVRYHFFSAAVF
jgi:hypothetical protein